MSIFLDSELNFELKYEMVATYPYCLHDTSDCTRVGCLYVLVGKRLSDHQ